MAVGRQDYEDRKEQKIAAYENRAAKAGEEAGALFDKSHKMAEAIPFGQPILVGHHSEKSDRSYRGRIERGYEKAHEASGKAEYYQGKAAAAAGNRAISGDNPEAIALYQAKLAKLEAAQERMRAINKAFKKGDPALKELGLTDEQIAKMRAAVEADCLNEKPYPTWALSNNNAEIRRIKEKIESLTKLDSMEAEVVKFPGGELRQNIEINRVQFVFDDVPSPETRALLKSHGFKWAPSESAWQRQRTLSAINTAKYLQEAFCNFYKEAGK